MKKLLVFLLAVLLVVGVAGLANALPLINGDFETGNLTGWTTFVDTNGSVGSGFPKVVSFDVNQDSTNSNAAAFRVGHVGANNPDRLGGGIVQSVLLSAGTWNIGADIATSNLYYDDVYNADGGLFELLFDGVVIDSHDFGGVGGGQIESAMLFSSIVVEEGSYDLGIRMSRNYVQAFSAPIQYLDNISISPVPEPATMILLGVGLVGLAGFGRKKFFRK